MAMTDDKTQLVIATPKAKRNTKKLAKKLKVAHTSKSDIVTPLIATEYVDNIILVNSTSNYHLHQNILIASPSTTQQVLKLILEIMPLAIAASSLYLLYIESFARAEIRSHEMKDQAGKGWLGSYTKLGATFLPLVLKVGGFVGTYFGLNVL